MAGSHVTRSPQASAESIGAPTGSATPIRGPDSTSLGAADGAMLIEHQTTAFNDLSTVGAPAPGSCCRENLVQAAAAPSFTVTV